MAASWSSTAAKPPGAVLYDNGHYLLFYCPGCECLHAVWLEHEPNPLNGKFWNWNRDLVKPTVTPSLVIQGDPQHGRKHCHLIITHGTIQYLNDCEHRLAGCTIPMIADPVEQV